MTENEKLQEIWKSYEDEHDHLAVGTAEVVRWAVSKGLMELPKIDPYEIASQKMSRALREEYATDEHGRRYRVNHAIKVSINGVQTTIWGILGHAPRKHMETAFAQRREQIIGDCFHLKTDVDVYNDLNPTEQPIQLGLDFTEDVAEREVMLVS